LPAARAGGVTGKSGSILTGPVNHSAGPLPEPHLSAGGLRSVLDDWCQPYSGYHLYYPSRRQASAAFTLVVEALRYRARPKEP